MFTGRVFRRDPHALGLPKIELDDDFGQPAFPCRTRTAGVVLTCPLAPPVCRSCRLLAV